MRYSNKFSAFTLVLVRAVQNRLVRAQALTQQRQRLNRDLAQPFALRIRVHDNILNVPNYAQIPQELVLHEDNTGSDQSIRICSGQDDEVIVCRFQRFQLSETGFPVGRRDSRSGCQMGEQLNMATRVIIRGQWSDLHAGSVQMRYATQDEKRLHNKVWCELVAYCSRHERIVEQIV